MAVSIGTVSVGSLLFIHLGRAHPAAYSIHNFFIHMINPTIFNVAAFAARPNLFFDLPMPIVRKAKCFFAIFVYVFDAVVIRHR